MSPLRRRVERLEADARIDRGEDLQVVLLQCFIGEGAEPVPTHAEIRDMIGAAVEAGRAANEDEVMVVQLVPGRYRDYHPARGINL